MNQYNIIMKEIIHPVKFHSGEQEQHVYVKWPFAEYEAYDKNSQQPSFTGKSPGQRHD